MDRISELGKLRSMLATRMLNEWDELTAEQRRGVFESMRDARVEQDALVQQRDWHTRATTWTWPTEPAWTD